MMIDALIFDLHASRPHPSAMKQARFTKSSPNNNSMNISEIMPRLVTYHRPNEANMHWMKQQQCSASKQKLVTS
jgi:hypothetical protein